MGARDWRGTGRRRRTCTRCADLIQIEPLGFETRCDARRILVSRRCRAGQRLRPPFLFEQHNDIGQTEPGRIGLEARPDLVEQPGCRRVASRPIRARRRLGLAGSFRIGPDREFAIERRGAQRIAETALHDVGVGLFRHPHDGLDQHGAIGFELARRQAQLARKAPMRERAAKPERPLQRASRHFARDLLDQRDVPAPGVHDLDLAADDVDGSQRQIFHSQALGGGRSSGLRAPGRWRDWSDIDLAGWSGASLPGLRRAELDQDFGMQQLHFAGLDLPLQQRRDRQPQREGIGTNGRLAEAAVLVRDAHILEAEVGRRQETEIDAAADPHLAADENRGLLLEHVAIAVPIDKQRHGKQRRTHTDHHGTDEQEHVVHGRPRARTPRRESCTSITPATCP